MEEVGSADVEGQRQAEREITLEGKGEKHKHIVWTIQLLTVEIPC